MGLEVGRAAAVRYLRLSAALGLLLWLPAGTSPAADPAAAPDDPVPQLREVRARLEAGDPAGAARLLEPLVAGDLGAHALLLRARILGGLGDLEGAWSAAGAGLERTSLSEVRARLHLERGRIARAREDWPAAYREQRSAWESSRDPDLAVEAIVDLARAFEAKGLPADALRLYETAWREWPLAERSGEAFERARYLAQATGAPEATPDTLIGRADRLRGRYRCDEALVVYDLLLGREEPEEEPRERAEQGRARCLFQRQRYEEALAAYLELAAREEATPETRIMVARTRARLGDTSEAVRELLEIGQRHGGAVRVRTEYLAAVLLRQPDPERSKKLLARLERQRVVPGIARASRWRLAWSDLGAGEMGRAEKRLRPLARGSLFDIEVQRARYWLAMARRKTAPSKGMSELREIAETLPLSYYGLLAARQVDGQAPPLEREFLGERDHSDEDASIVRARRLAEGGFPELAQDELQSRLREGGLSREERVAAAFLLHDLGDHFRAVRLLVDGFGDSLEQGIDPAWREVWSLAWPRPFPGPVASAVSEFDGDPSLVYAVMREESTYRPEAESPAGALGLMQLIPPTATRIAETLGVDPFDAGELFAPEVNVRFGTYYLKHLLGRFEGRPPLAIAAYNAGPEAVSRWLAESDGFASDVFVESVPYGETRRYLRKVLRSYQMYRLLYGPRRDAAANGAQPEADTRR